ncbi:MAG: malate dehydrogenase [Alphaproteobacteria bacterium]|nr:malate dehydrogenase [Alphaproteobacteria bacterium]
MSSKQFNPKIALVGSGQIGGMLALLAGLKKLSNNIVLLDVIDGVPQGKALDTAQAFACEGLTCKTCGSADLSASSEGLKDADVVIVTAGFPRKPGMSRDELLLKNASVIGNVGLAVKSQCPGAFVVCITNPLDAMVAKLQETSGLPAKRVVGMAGILDTSRFRTFLGEALGVSPRDVHSMVLGGHGDAMVPLVECTSIAGIPLQKLIETNVISQSKVDEIVQRTRLGGGEIVDLLKTGSAFIAPASSALQMVESYLRDEKRLLPCCAQMQGEYGFKNLYGGVPVIIGKEGVEKIVQIPFSKNSTEEFNASMKKCQDLMAELKRIESEAQKN